MAQFSDDLFHLRGRVKAARPNIGADFVNESINDRLRQILDNRTFWADLLKFGILSFPDPYSTGAASMANGNTTVTGVADPNGVLPNWPVRDVVDTTLPGGVSEYGYVEVEPASMTGITADSMLWVDADGDPEAVPVVEVARASFIAHFAKTHNAGCKVWMSSLASQQFRVSQAYPIFTVAAVTSPTTLTLTLAWGGPALAAQQYTIKRMYVTLASDLKAIIAIKDEQTGYPVRLHVPLEEADNRDPRRALVSGNPYYGMVDLGANDMGNMLYEVWPAPGSARQFSYAYWKQWPRLVKDTDRPPYFINPSILFYGATADAKMHRVERNDPFYDPQGAEYYERKFQQGLQEAKNADEAKKLDAMRNPWWRSFLPGNYDQQQLNDVGATEFWSGMGF